MLAMDFIPSAANTILISDQLDNPPNKNSGLLDILPPELIFQILDSMEPHEYSGFSCTCRHAVTIVNQKLDTPQSREYASRDPFVSRTAAFVKAEPRVIIWGTVPEDCGCGWNSPVQDGDSDL